MVAGCKILAPLYRLMIRNVSDRVISFYSQAIVKIEFSLAERVRLCGDPEDGREQKCKKKKLFHSLIVSTKKHAKRLL